MSNYKFKESDFCKFDGYITRQRGKYFASFTYKVGALNGATMTPCMLEKNGQIHKKFKINVESLTKRIDNIEQNYCSPDESLRALDVLKEYGIKRRVIRSRHLSLK